MGEEREPFELEPDDEAAEVKGPRPAPAAPDVPAPPEEEPEAPSVSMQTVAERRGEVAPRGAVERLPNPPGWPGEALGFAFRRPGPGFVTSGVLVLALLDVASLSDALRFPGWMVKLFLLMYLLRAQFHVIGSSAAGRDAPVGWSRALEFDREKFSRYWRTLLFFAGALLPGSLAWIFHALAPGLLLLTVGSMYAAVIALGAGLLDGRLKWPWHALRWMATRPLHCLVGSLGWWMLLGAEFAVSGLRGRSVLLVAFVAVVLRVACMVGLLVSARVIGVMGRSWTP